MHILKKTLISIITCSLLIMSVGAEESATEETEAPLVYNTEEENTIDAGTDTTVVADDKNAEDVVDNSTDTDNVDASTPENNISSEPVEEVSNPVENTPTIELGEFKNEVTYNEEHTVATIMVEYLGECTELNLVNEEIIQQMVNAGVYQVNLEKGDWTNKIAFDVLVNGIVPLEINVWNEDTLVGTKMVMTSVTGLNNDALIFEPNQSSTYEIASSDVGSSDSRNMTLSYETNVSFTWSIPTELSMAGIEDNLTVTVNNSNLATETALRIRISSNNDYKLIDSQSGESLSYIATDMFGSKLSNGDVILDHLYNQDSTSNTIHFDLTQMPLVSGKYNDTLMFTASVERLLSDLYSGQIVTLSNIGTIHNLQNIKIYGVSKQKGTPSLYNPIEVQNVVNPAITIYNQPKQLISNGNFESVSGWETAYTIDFSVSDNVAYLKSGSTFGSIKNNIYCDLKGHKVLLTFSYRGNDVNWYYYGDSHAIAIKKTVLSPKEDWYFYSAIIDVSTDYNMSFLIFQCDSDGEHNLELKNVQLFDLTSMGLDYITSAEDFKQIFPGDYYKYAEENYSEQKASLNYKLNALPVDDGGNVVVDGQRYISDYVDIENKKIVRMVGQYILTGNEGWQLYSPSEYLHQFWTMDFGVKGVPYSSCMSNRFPYGVTSNNRDSYSTGAYLVELGTEFAFQFIGAKEDFPDVGSFINYVKLNDVILYYQLSVPEEVILTDEEIQAFKDLSTYSSTTFVSASSNQLTPYIEFGLS